MHTIQLTKNHEDTIESESERASVEEGVATHEEVQMESGESEAPELEEAHEELEGCGNEADDEEDVAEVMNAYMAEVAELKMRERESWKLWMKLKILGD